MTSLVLAAAITLHTVTTNADGTVTVYSQYPSRRGEAPACVVTQSTVLVNGRLTQTNKPYALYASTYTKDEYAAQQAEAAEIMRQLKEARRRSDESDETPKPHARRSLLDGRKKD